jgi:cysteinyl-tRNA synthetase
MLKVYNSLGRELQEFVPLRPGFIGVYVCGPTVYGHSHVGHAKSYVSFDVIVRYLRYRFPDCLVRYVQNITDVGHLTDDADMGEDKVGAKARELGIQPMEVAETFTRSYFEDMDALGVQRPDISPRATGHIPQQIELVHRLIETGHAYEVNGNVYFDVPSWPDYGKLSGRSLDEMLGGARVEAREEKRHPADFALWKRAESGHLMRWNSPWGEGFPGWHLECSVMAQTYLGETVDIHGGGIENIFPHHEDEVAQSEAATGKPFVRYWLHNNMVTVNGRKMGKSLGNFITLKDAFAGKPPLSKPVRPTVMRYFVLTSHYRSPLDFSAEALDAAEKGLERIENAVGRVRRALGSAADGERADEVRAIVERAREEFLAEMDNDFNTAGALGALSTFTREVNRLLDGNAQLGRGSLKALDDVYRELAGDVLGIDAGRLSRPAVIAVALPGQSRSEASTAIVTVGRNTERSLIELALEVRQCLRARKEFALGDRIRDRLAELGIEVKDGPEGPTWQFKQ